MTPDHFASGFREVLLISNRDCKKMNLDLELFCPSNMEWGLLYNALHCYSVLPFFVVALFFVIQASHYCQLFTHKFMDTKEPKFINTYCPNKFYVSIMLITNTVLSSCIN